MSQDVQQPISSAGGVASNASSGGAHLDRHLFHFADEHQALSDCNELDSSVEKLGPAKAFSNSFI